MAPVPRRGRITYERNEGAREAKTSDQFDPFPLDSSERFDKGAGESDTDVILNEAAAAREHIDDVFGNRGSLQNTDRKFRLLEGGKSADEPPDGPK